MGDDVELPQALHRDQRQRREVPRHMSDTMSHRQTAPTPTDGSDGDAPRRQRSSRSRSRRRWSAPSSTTRCRSSCRGRCPTCATASSRCTAGSSTACTSSALRPDRPHMKCARVTGDMMGKYHPHGDGAIYDALVRMAQAVLAAPPADRLPRQLRQRPTSAAGGRALHRVPARRRWPCRCSPSIDEDTVDFGPNYTNEFQEPDRAARPVPEPAGQRQPGHRGRHGHQHPAAQPRRGHRRDHPPHRQSRAPRPTT